MVRDVKEVPHLLVRLTLTGPTFQDRAPEPFIQVGRSRSLFVSIDEDGLRAHGYFDEVPAGGEMVEFGFGHQVLLQFPPFNASNIERLDRAKLPIGTQIPSKLGGEG